MEKKKPIAQMAQSKIPELNLVGSDWPDLGHTLMPEPITVARDLELLVNLSHLGLIPGNEWESEVNLTQITWLRIQGPVRKRERGNGYQKAVSKAHYTCLLSQSSVYLGGGHEGSGYILMEGVAPEEKEVQREEAGGRRTNL